MTSQIQPLDREEVEHIAFKEKWIDSGEEIVRIAKPATPGLHSDREKIRLTKGKKSCLLMEFQASSQFCRVALLFPDDGPHV